ncbi:sporulation-specific diadenylate cyclase CdaS [Bacillus sp. B1-b2]|uniref:sporulation-specific diadenylate cyclase CdaS n=1 Tax=Bacillus sp. B1-b2 TaxID=2653201 RepID=UPI0012620B64|nr:sporulation-specific diadenylate cyclase CdaS [Bacillus sp. B1-b2]KAB7665134.1 diadenylate cyclase [Bacillus sp. B1-b2]
MTNERLPSDISREMEVQLEHLQNNIAKLQLSVKEKDCCILHEFEELNKLFKHIHNRTATYYLQLYLEPYTEFMDTLTTACQQLSEKRHGALIAVKRENPIESLVHSGIPLHAKLSSSLLEAVFYPGNPLHDGGIIIEKDTIISAGNIFPTSLYYNGKEKEKLGTRHRAAIGLSEVSDAMILVVSEETGRISFALEGNLYPIQPGLS